ncbi:hypothetical protein [Candidatus Kryptobacter tengchongensis]|uniref:BON domain-containing protein n=1 Tax=Kryptobacter tengchongensis TaxID=1643429 RepID=A0A656D7P4_KRYT1|nr:hypothetical protein [Candidatus Kryptobacter tengchongensis]CUT02124.1 hypothetical protein JGI24_01066 [Candidatus Kryptobacter tengchongensis]
MKKTLNFWILFLMVSSVFSQENLYENLIQEISQKYVPDKRVGVFDVKIYERENVLILKGETTVKEAKYELVSKLKQNSVNVIDSVIILPSPELGDKVYGVINVSVAT